MEHCNCGQNENGFPELQLKSSSNNLLQESSISLMQTDSLKLDYTVNLSRSSFSGDVLEVGESAIFTDSDTVSSIIECSEIKPRRYSSPFTPVSKRICSSPSLPVLFIRSIFTHSPKQRKSH